MFDLTPCLVVFDKIERMINAAGPQEHVPEPHRKWAINDFEVS